MTTAVSTPVVHTITEVPRKWKISIVLSVLSVVAFVVFGLFGDDRTALIVFSETTDAIVIPNLPVTSKVLCLIVGVLLLVSTVGVVVLSRREDRNASETAKPKL